MRIEFQAVILCGVDEAIELFPLSNGTPVPLLPIANTPLLEYQLLFFFKAKFSSIIVVVPEEMFQEISCFVQTFSSNHSKNGHEMKILVRYCKNELSSSTIEMIRTVKDELITDVIVVRGDLITDLSLNDIADMHRINASSLTTVLKEIPKGKTTDEYKKLQRRYTKKGVVNYVGLVPPSNKARGTARSHFRLLFSKVLGSDESLRVSKALLKRESKVEVRTDVMDPHFYIFSKWVLDYMLSKPKMTSIQNDFLPYFCQLQYRDPRSYLPDTIQATLGLSLSYKNDILQTYLAPNPLTLVSCMTYLLSNEQCICERVDSVQNYLLVNKQVLNSAVTPNTPWNKPIKKPLSLKDVTTKNSVIGKGTTIESGCTLKDCIIGENCVIGSGSKLNNCVVMTEAIIRNDCVLQGTIIGSGAVIEARCSLNDCQVEGNAVVKEKRAARNEAILVDSDELVSF